MKLQALTLSSISLCPERNSFFWYDVEFGICWVWQITGHCVQLKVKPLLPVNCSCQTLYIRNPSWFQKKNYKLWPFLFGPSFLRSRKRQGKSSLYLEKKSELRITGWIQSPWTVQLLHPKSQAIWLLDANSNFCGRAVYVCYFHKKCCKLFSTDEKVINRCIDFWEVFRKCPHRSWPNSRQDNLHVSWILCVISGVEKQWTHLSKLFLCLSVPVWRRKGLKNFQSFVSRFEYILADCSNLITESWSLKFWHLPINSKRKNIYGGILFPINKFSEWGVD